MTLLAEARQTTISPATTELYVRQLRGYDIRDIEKAMMAFATEPREAFKTPFPELGAIIQRVETYRDDRGRRPKFVSCGFCKAGFVITADDKYSYATECDCLRRWRGGEQANVPDPIAEHLREVQEHPERFVPVDACIQVGKALTAARMERAKGPNPMTGEEYRALKKKLTREMNDKWLEQLRDDSSDRKTVAAGA